ncbi:hypothetical protein DKM44_05130 [Deinococcus irradiatisoli]|uniref:Uncharacterized protein n=2 Tax=Deinococcus irradiatisoli TaxID=2202254 RepID=A0A2Z3JCC6_9DEIO|nr:hypothetical protein DKM44_05130 [Deinococcus irradiatisoli]
MNPKTPAPTTTKLLHLALLGLLALILGRALWWGVSWFASAFGYQSNDANLPVVLALSTVVFAAVLLALSPTSAGRHARKRLRLWWRS